MRLAPGGPVGRLLDRDAPAGARVPRRLVAGDGVLLVLLEVRGGTEAAVGVARRDELVCEGTVLFQPLRLWRVSMRIGQLPGVD